MFQIRTMIMSTHFARYSHTSKIAMAASKSNLAKLRKKTGFPFGNCKKALEVNNDDLEKAEKWLEDQAKELGWSKAMKMESRNTPQGLVGIALDEHHAAIVELNCETDFVAKNEKFQKLVDLVAKTCLHHTKAENPSPKSTSKVTLDGTEVGKLSIPGDHESITDQVIRAVGLVGEKLVVRRAALVSVAAQTHLAGHVHPVVPKQASAAPETLLGKYGALLAYSAASVDNSSANLAKQLCQHVIGMNPVKIEASPDDPTPVVEQKPPVQDSPDDEDQLMIKGDEDETIMMRQSFLLDPDRTVADVVAEGGITVLDFVRFECGETVSDEVEVVTTKVAHSGG